MIRYKLILVQAAENVTAEYANVVTGLQEARERARQMIDDAEEGYCDTYVACYEYDEDIRMPFDDYRCFKYDSDGDWWEGWMRMGAYCRVGMYQK